MAVSHPQSHPAQPDQASSPLIRVSHLHKRFPIKKGLLHKTVGNIHAVSDVSLDIYPGEIMGLVGESGCGKSTLGRCILQLIRPSEGQVLFDGTDLTKLSPKALRPYRRDMQIVFQNPYSSLDPRMSIGDTLSEPFLIHGLARGHVLAAEVKQLIDIVGLPKDTATRFPHELSGGQRQRVCIARALALKPKFIVADEPVSALDVSVQAQILNLLKDLKDTYNLTYLFIAHNLSVVEYLCDRIAVMYLGEIVEQAPSAALATHPYHPYSQALISAVSVPDPTYDRSQRILLQGDLPSPDNPPSGCRFHTRCRHAQARCAEETPVMAAVESTEMGKDTRWVHCHFTREINNL